MSFSYQNRVLCYAFSVPRFDAFRGIRYNPELVDLDLVTAPPYDVIDEELRQRLEARSPYNAVRVELSRDEPTRDRYQAARCTFDEWLAEGVLAWDEELAFYVVRMGFHDERGRPRQTVGVIGALELAPIGGGEVLPHERTMPKPKGDRLHLLRACRANLSPIWGVSTAEGLSTLCELPGPPDARCTDELGVHHRLWRVTSPGTLEAIAETVASAPVIIADGHHRYETALAYRDEQRRAAAGQPGPYDLIMAFVVELVEEQLSVRPIHRLLSGLPEGFDLPAALAGFFEMVEAGPPGDERLAHRMQETGALGLITGTGSWLLRPVAETSAAADHDLDASLLEVALAGLPPHDLAFEHGVDNVVQAVEKGGAQAAILLRPAAVAQIAEAGRAGMRMPEKTTFFYPKPRTGLVFRRL